MKHQRGFTLIELSIVLVIIGLVAGGVLVGRDLIKASEIRATISQKIRYDTAVNTFKLKYNGLPGDLFADRADELGFFSLDNSPLQGFGDNNGLIQSRTVGIGVNYGATGETILFWRHLVEAGMMEGLYGTGIVAATGDADPADQNKPELYMPNTKFLNTVRFRVVELRGVHYYWLSSHNTIEVSGQVSLGPGMARIDAYFLDQKMDDGMPNTGTVTAAAAFCFSGGNPLVPMDACWAADPNNNGACITGGTGTNDPMATYIVGPENIASINRCGLLTKLD
ncbi:MAG: prepilin-type N-terminal cleavage/methylation domain-containing protein [Rickettsiales bacterium]|jgi:prepilin-type N-terminal cleavage/methylation domain-containing protein|nr:prepilin-type N-terminal cleavage/methylation domain-containing protein [Rickettsiales bacterium]